MVSQLTSIKQGEVVVALSRGRGFIMMWASMTGCYGLFVGPDLPYGSHDLPQVTCYGIH